MEVVRMREKIGYYGMLVCLLLSVISGQFLKSEWVPVILCIGVLIFAPMYRWNEWKAYSRKRNSFQHRICHYNQHNSVFVMERK